MLRKMMVAGGGMAVLSAGVLIGGLTTGLVGAKSSQTPPAAQATAAAAGEGADGPDAAVTLPAGSISANQAKQAAVAYVQKTTPYSGQGLQPASVQIDDENGTILFSVDFSNSAKQEVEVKVATSGSVIGVASADSGTGGQDAADGADAAGGQNEAPGQETADGPNGGQNTPAPGATGTAQPQ